MTRTKNRSEGSEKERGKGKRQNWGKRIMRRLHSNSSIDVVVVVGESEEDEGRVEKTNCDCKVLTQTPPNFHSVFNTCVKIM